MNIQKLYSLTRQAVDLYGMIEENDRIAVGISGGKDSLSLLVILAGLQKFYPKHFELSAITCDTGFTDMDFSEVSKLCGSLGVSYEIIHTDISKIITSEKLDKSPCYLCAKLRKGAIYDRLTELGINKIAYGHHKDDFIETAFMSLIYEGRFYSFPPVTKLDKTGITVIRPMMFVPEAAVAGLAKEMELPVVKNQCPFDGSTKRAYAKSLIEGIVKENPRGKDRIMHAIMHAGLEDWPEGKDGGR